MDSPFDGSAHWIWSAESTTTYPRLGHHDNYRVRFFRRVFAAPENTTRVVIHVSADSRYVLWFNAHLVGRGPARGDITHHFYDTYDLTDRVQPGQDNVLAAMVIYCGDVMPNFGITGAPCGLMIGAPGLILDGSLATDDPMREPLPLHTNSQWRVLDDPGAYRHEHCESNGTFTGYTERFTATEYPWNWQQADYEDASWSAATEICPGVRPDTVRDTLMPHRLIPRQIPVMESTPVPLGRWMPDNASWQALLDQSTPVVVPPHSHQRLVLARDAMTTAFPRLSWSGGGRASLTLTYVEALRKDGVKQRGAHPQGEVVGVYDRIFCGGGPQESWESWHYRTFRYLQIDVTTEDEPLTLKEFGATFWAYPYTLQARLETNDPFHTKFLEVCFRTLQLCAHETFEDCPYYEQLAYAGDCYVQEQVSALLTGDTRLSAQTIRLFDWSRNAEGMTMSRYPCRLPQIIPAWSQLWVLSILAHYRQTGDLDIVRETIHGALDVLRWFDARREDGPQGLGLVGKLSYWAVLDWSPEWDAENRAGVAGVPPGSYEGPSAAHNFLHLWCLRAVSALLSALEQHVPAQDYRVRAEQLARTAHMAFWDAERGAYRDRPGNQPPEYSQLTNALAILSDTAPQSAHKAIAARLIDDTLSRAGYFGHSFIYDALAKAGAFDAVWRHLEIYRDLIERQEMSTLPEDIVLQRSDCHAWSTGGIYHLLTHGLGVQPLEPGYAAILIAPQPGALTRLRGRVPTPHGMVSVTLEKDASGWTLDAETPPGIPVVVALPGEPEQRFAEGGRIVLRSTHED